MQKDLTLSELLRLIQDGQSRGLSEVFIGSGIQGCFEGGGVKGQITDGIARWTMHNGPERWHMWTERPASPEELAAL